MHSYPEAFELMISAEEIRRRTVELGRELSETYAGCDLVLIGVLKGSVPFLSDLARAIEIPLRLDFLRVRSYSGEQSTGTVRLEFDLTQPITGKHVLLVEDIVDSGRTMRFLLETLRLRKPASLKVVTLLDKREERVVDVPTDYVGFPIENRFVIGYGLDYYGLYRNLPMVLAKREGAVLEELEGAPDS